MILRKKANGPDYNGDGMVTAEEMSRYREENFEDAGYHEPMGFIEEWRQRHEAEPLDFGPRAFGPNFVHEGGRIISGGPGDNRDIQGTDGNEWIFGDGGDDEIEAGGGHDNIDGGDGDDIINPGDGADVVGLGLDGDDDRIDFADSDGATDMLYIHMAFEGGPNDTTFGHDRVENFGSEDIVALQAGLELHYYTEWGDTAMFSIVDDATNAHLGFLEVQGDWGHIDFV